MRSIYKSLYSLNKNRKQIGEMVLIVGAIYTYFLYSSVARGWQNGQKTTVNKNN